MAVLKTVLKKQHMRLIKIEHPTQFIVDEYFIILVVLEGYLFDIL